MLDLDANIENSDWTKRFAWDIPATNADELLAYLAQVGMSVEHFKTLPVYRYNAIAIPWLATLEAKVPS